MATVEELRQGLSLPPWPVVLVLGGASDPRGRGLSQAGLPLSAVVLLDPDVGSSEHAGIVDAFTAWQPQPAVLVVESAGCSSRTPGDAQRLAGGLIDRAVDRARVGLMIWPCEVTAAGVDFDLDRAIVDWLIRHLP